MIIQVESNLEVERTFQNVDPSAQIIFEKFREVLDVDWIENVEDVLQQGQVDQTHLAIVFVLWEEEVDAADCVISEYPRD